MSEKRSAIQYWNFLREDSPLKGAISFRMQQRNLSFVDLGIILGTKPSKIRNYLKSKTPNLNNFEIIKLSKLLGIDVNISVKFEDSLDGAP